MTASTWRFWIDRGGTFTDVIGCAPDNTTHTLKLLSASPAHYTDAAAEGVHRILAKVCEGSAIPRDISEIRMGTTVATNALLEKSGAATALLTTRGFRDVLRIGNQNRPAIFDLCIRKMEMLYRDVAEVNERIDANGTILEALQPIDLEPIFDQWHSDGIESVAICFMHAWRNGTHEKAAAKLARAAGFDQVSASHEVSPLMKFVSRSSTTVADAYLSPVLLQYVRGFQEALAAHDIACPRILFMQSNGGLVTAELFRGKDSILSGPAGGVVGMGATAHKAGLTQLIGFDMGGTSTDVSIYAGAPEVVDETTIAGVHMRSPMIRIHSIAAGGGSILAYTDGRLQVGPESAGANPGPISYGHGGPLTITDANIMLGRIQPRWFPRIFGPNADQPLNVEKVHHAFTRLTRQLNATGLNYSSEQTAAGFLSVAIENMANALRHISIRRGLDPATFTLCCFGGAGGQHACQVADSVGMTRILLDPLAPVLSAWGMGAAVLSCYRQLAVNELLEEAALARLEQHCTVLAAECRATLRDQGIKDITLHRWLHLKVAGSDMSLPIAADNLTNLREAFFTAHRARFGFAPSDSNAEIKLEIESVRVEAASTQQPMPTGNMQSTTVEAGAQAETDKQAEIYLAGRWQTVPTYERLQLHPGTSLAGPALITEANSTTIVEPGWTLTVNDARQLLLERTTELQPKQHESGAADPVQLEIFNNRFMHVAEEMGAVLQQTARSVNIKERLDFSCALFTTAGDLIANAPHIPVHLGSMDDSIKVLLQQHPAELLAGTSFLANAPYNGGTHLPDITVISPVLDAAGDLLFMVASRAHHADIGGITPGSMPPNSRHIGEEGIVFDNLAIVSNGEFLEDDLRTQLMTPEYPARNPDQNVADIKAQIAANERGRMLLLEMVQQHGGPIVAAYTQHVQDNAEESVRRAIERLGQLGTECFRYPFDNGQQICVRVRVDHDKREATIDFTGTSAAQDNNLNAPVSVCRAAVLYVFRTLVNANIPLNAGCLKPLNLIIPEGCMLSPRFPAAVVGGNVETSQCVTDALYGALGVLAASQGTMNNLSFGNDEFQYYETICGGAGAGANFDGADAVQTHMTNSRMTDAEVLESRLPVLVREFSIRPNSGGTGAHVGGNGAVRKLEFRTTMSAAILSNHRSIPPFGLAGGGNALTGQNLIVRRDGSIEEPGGIVMTKVHEGDVMVIKTPGGGGYGVPPDTK